HEIGVEGVGDPHQRVELRRPAAPLEPGDGGLRRPAQDGQLLLAHPPVHPVVRDHPPDLGEALLVVAPERLRALADALAHALERLRGEAMALAVRMACHTPSVSPVRYRPPQPVQAAATRNASVSSVRAIRRLTITWVGAVTPVGTDAGSMWDALVSGRSGVDVIRSFDASDFPVNIAAEVKDFDPAAAMSPKEVRRTSTDVHFGVAAAIEAARDAELVVDEPSRVGVVIGSVMGGLAYTLRQQAILDERGWERVSPHWLPNTLVDTTTSHVATMLGARGLNYSTESACATGTHAIGEAAAAIERGQADVILAGATESAMLPIILAGFCAMRALVDGRDDPAAASRPFDLTRSGFVMAEGAAVVVLEELDRARRRDARIYGEVVGYGASNDAYHVATPHPES